MAFAVFEGLKAENVFSASHTATAQASVARDLRWVYPHVKLLLASYANTNVVTVINLYLTVTTVFVREQLQIAFFCFKDV